MPLKRHIASNDQAGNERPAWRKRIASFCQPRDVFRGKCVIELTKNCLKVGHW
jgi:hypothetical protein